jgi:hypothetical protein
MIIPHQYNEIFMNLKNLQFRLSTLLLILCCTVFCTNAQPGIAEMNQATGNIRQSFFSARDTSLILASIFSITGAVKIYYNWQMGKDRITPEVAGWFFASLFMILAGPFLQQLFGI